MTIINDAAQPSTQALELDSPRGGNESETRANFIPQGWAAKRLKYTAALNPDQLPETTDLGFEFRYIDIGKVDSLGRTATSDPISFANAPSRARRPVQPGDVIVSTVRTYLKATALIGVSDLPIVVSTGFAVLRAKRELIPKFLWYLVQSDQFVSSVVSRSEGIGYPAIAPSQVGDVAVWFPSESRQRTIAAFLDRISERIDVLIAKKELLLELLDEKRANVISTSVLRGVDGAELGRNSRVKWIGAVPKHWTCCALRYISRTYCDGPFGSGLKSEHYSSWGIRVIRLQNVGFGTFHGEDEAFIDPAYYAQLGDHSVIPDDVLVAGLGDDNNSVGRACVSPPDLGPAMVKADCFRFRLDARVAVPAFVALQLSATARDAGAVLSTGSTRGRVNLSSTAGRIVALPPLEEQVRIVDHVVRETSNIDALAARVRDGIQRLKEYRSAVITAAVTGQIDVRGEVAA